MKRILLGSVAAAAMLVMAGGAMAGSRHYDPSVTDWDWYKNKYETVIINTWIWGFFDPTGETEVKSVQTFIGDVVAGAVLMGDYAPYEFSVDTSATSGSFGGGFFGVIDAEASLHGVVEDDPAYCTRCGYHPADYDPVWMHGDVNGYVYGQFGGYYNEFTVDTHFAKVLQTAEVGLGDALQEVSAAGIVKQVESAVPIYAFIEQDLTGDDYQPANIAAYAVAGSYFDPIELAVEQSVSAVAEIVSLEVAAASEGEYLDPTICTWCGPMEITDPFAHVRTDLIIEADINQFAKADVSATASLVQDLSSFTKLGSYDRLGEVGQVAIQSVSAAGLVSSIKNAVAP